MFGTVEVPSVLRQSRTKEVQKLERMLYLEHWDQPFPATFKEAPPVCYLCRQAGYIKADCPVLANVTCLHCRCKGHTTRKCKVRIESFKEELESYKKAKENQAKEKQQGKDTSQKAKNSEDIQNDVREPTEQEVSHQEDLMLMDEIRTEQQSGHLTEKSKERDRDTEMKTWRHSVSKTSNNQ
jgi:hypothetical protein